MAQEEVRVVPMLLPRDALDLCMVQCEYGRGTGLFTYLFDPGRVDHSIPLLSNFSRCRSPVHVGVLVAQWWPDRVAWEVTNVRARPGFGPMMYYGAFNYASRMCPDRSITRPKAQRIWDTLESRGFIVRNELDSFSRTAEFFAFEDANPVPWLENGRRYLQSVTGEYDVFGTVDRIVDVVVRGYATVDLSKP